MVLVYMCIYIYTNINGAILIILMGSMLPYIYIPYMDPMGFPIFPCRSDGGPCYHRVPPDCHALPRSRRRPDVHLGGAWD